MHVQESILLPICIICLMFGHINAILKNNNCIMNDDYCDCGYDEPNTSACSGIFSSASSHLFHCKDTGVLNQSFPHSRVHDRLCDCCDGSDESENYCLNTCEEESRSFMEELNKSKLLKQKGYKMRKSIVDEASSKVNSILTSLNSNKNLVKQKEIEVNELKGKLAPLEIMEKSDRDATVRRFRDGIFTNLQDTSGKRLSSSHVLHIIASLVMLGNEDDVQATLLELDEFYELDGDEPKDASAFAIAAAKCSHKLNGQEAMASNGEVFLSDSISQVSTVTCSMASIETMAKSLSLTRLADEGVKTIFYNIIKRALEHDKEQIFQVFEYHHVPRGITHVILQSIAEASDTNHANTSANSIRLSIEALNNDILTLKKSIEEAERVSAYNFGPEFFLYPLLGQCFSSTHKGYRYEICPFKEAKQDHVRLGSYQRFEVLDKDEEIKLYFENGDRCFATQQPRNMIITMICSPDTQLKEVDEPSICSYAATLESPLACLCDPFSR
jgi:protein kinase C substrate 80K-H